jgi:hypothetical protein
VACRAVAAAVRRSGGSTRRRFDGGPSPPELADPLLWLRPEPFRRALALPIKEDRKSVV